MAQILKVDPKPEPSPGFEFALVRHLQSFVVDAITQTLADAQSEAGIEIRFDQDSDVIRVCPTIPKLKTGYINFKTGDMDEGDGNPIRMSFRDREELANFAMTTILQWYRLHRDTLEDPRVANLIIFLFRRGRMIAAKLTAEAAVPIPPGLDKGGCM